MLISNSHLQTKQPPWRYIALTAVFFTVVVMLFATRHTSPPILQDIHGATQARRTELVNHISNSTLGFEKVLAVSLPERTDHRDALILATAVSNIEVEFVDGVQGNTVPEKALPPGEHEGLNLNTIGSWRAHLNAIARVVHNNYTSALIMEDDVDWDVRLKSLLKDFALSSNALAQSNESSNFELSHLPQTTPPQVSPYGDDWDLLWLGHCGIHLPATGLVIHSNDSSVPEWRYLHSWNKDERTPLGMYPPHTRIVMRQSTVPVCSLAYAVSQRGARKLLYGLALKKLDAPFDVMLRAWCQGSDGYEQQICPGVLPQLFDHHRRRGPESLDSDISKPIEAYRDKPVTLNIRWSVRINMEKILRGETDYDDQYPDTQ